MIRPFHLAIPVHNISSAIEFYGGVLGCEVGRSSEAWVDFNFCGHQLVAHLGGISPVERGEILPTSLVDGEQVPVPHFGVVCDFDEFERMEQRIRNGGVAFVIEPTVRFPGEPGEQRTMFFFDPSGNAIEIKAFADIEAMLFAC
jgi:extradiol dioxygenase family protein